MNNRLYRDRNDNVYQNDFFNGWSNIGRFNPPALISNNDFSDVDVGTANPGLKGLWQKILDRFQNNSFAKQAAQAPQAMNTPVEGASLGTTLGNASNKLGQGMSNLKSKVLGFGDDYAKASGSPLWSSGKGIDKLGTVGNVIGGIYQGANALQGISEAQKASSDLESLLMDIENSAYDNPISDMYLDNEQRKLLRDVNKDRFDKPGITDAISGGIKGIPKALLSTGVGFLTGGLPGAAIQGIGSLVNSGIEGYNSALGESEAELEALYNTLLEAEQDYNSMRRANVRGAGLNTRSFNSLY